MRGREREQTDAAVRGRYERVWPAWTAGATDGGERRGSPPGRDERLWSDLTVFGDPWDVGPDPWPAGEADPARPAGMVGPDAGATGGAVPPWPSGNAGLPPSDAWSPDADAGDQPAAPRSRRRPGSEPMSPRARFIDGPDAPPWAGSWPDHESISADPGGSRPPAGAQVLAALSPGRRGLKALAVLAGVIALVAAFVAWQSRPQTVPVPTSSAGPAAPVGAPSPGTSTTPSPAVLVVAVEGRVRHPGLVRLPPGSRVADALMAAGGVLPGTDMSFVNLARKVVDGELIVIGMTPPPGTQTGAAEPSGASAGGIVDLNTATETDLETLPGIGPALAQRILDYRTQHGGFRSIDELRNVPGIGDAKFAQIKNLVTV